MSLQVTRDRFLARHVAKPSRPSIISPNIKSGLPKLYLNSLFPCTRTRRFLSRSKLFFIVAPFICVFIFWKNWKVFKIVFPLLEWNECPGSGRRLIGNFWKNRVSDHNCFKIVNSCQREEGSMQILRNDVCHCLPTSKAPVVQAQEKSHESRGSQRANEKGLLSLHRVFGVLPRGQTPQETPSYPRQKCQENRWKYKICLWIPLTI